MDVRADLGEGGVGIWMRNVFAFEKGNVSISAMDVLFYMPDPKQWDKSAFSMLRLDNAGNVLTYSPFLLFPPFVLF